MTSTDDHTICNVFQEIYPTFRKTGPLNNDLHTCDEHKIFAKSVSESLPRIREHDVSGLVVQQGCPEARPSFRYEDPV